MDREPSFFHTPSRESRSRESRSDKFTVKGPMMSKVNDSRLASLIQHFEVSKVPDDHDEGTDPQTSALSQQEFGGSFEANSPDMPAEEAEDEYNAIAQGDEQSHKA